MKKVIVTGATGLVGRSLVPALLKRNMQVVVFTRSIQKATAVFGDKATYRQWGDNNDWRHALEHAEAVYHLAGTPIAKRWTAKHKHNVLVSRRDGTMMLAKAISECAAPPKFFFSTSAIGYYGNKGETVLTEESPPAVETDFLSMVCQEWERSARIAQTTTRLIIGRIGIVFSPVDGALAKMLPAFRLGLGGPLGNGKQWWSWIHPEDLIGAMIWFMENSSLQGVFNLTAPSPERMKQIANIMGTILNRPSLLPVPEVILRLAMGESAMMPLHSQHVIPEALLQAGYHFKFADANSALHDLLNRKTT